MKNHPQKTARWSQLILIVVAAALLADVAPSGCGKRTKHDRPMPKEDSTPAKTPASEAGKTQE